MLVKYSWNSRVTSLIKVAMLPPVRLAGFYLLHLTFTASTDSLIRESKEVLALALNILEANKDPALFVAALEVIRLILARSMWHAEWARDVVGAAMIQRTVKALVKAAQMSSIEVSPCIIFAQCCRLRAKLHFAALRSLYLLFMLSCLSYLSSRRHYDLFILLCTIWPLHCSATLQIRRWSKPDLL